LNFRQLITRITLITRCNHCQKTANKKCNKKRARENENIETHRVKNDNY